MPSRQKQALLQCTTPFACNLVVATLFLPRSEGFVEETNKELGRVRTLVEEGLLELRGQVGNSMGGKDVYLQDLELLVTQLRKRAADMDELMHEQAAAWGRLSVEWSRSGRRRGRWREGHGGEGEREGREGGREGERERERERRKRRRRRRRNGEAGFETV